MSPALPHPTLAEALDCPTCVCELLDEMAAGVGVES